MNEFNPPRFADGAFLESRKIQKSSYNMQVTQMQTCAKRCAESREERTLVFALRCSVIVARPVLLSWSLTDVAALLFFSFSLCAYTRTDLPPTIFCSFEKADFFHSTEYSFMKMYTLLVSCASLFCSWRGSHSNN